MCAHVVADCAFVVFVLKFWQEACSLWCDCHT